MKNLILTCDTEALELPLNESAVERNIFGRQLNNTDRACGIGLMMDCCDEYGVKMNFFYDVFTEYGWPGINKRVCRFVAERGHNLCLHAHIEHLNPHWWSSRGYNRPTWAANYFDETAARFVYEDAVSLFERATGLGPLAFRAGAWRYCSQTLQALRELSVEYSYNYYPATTTREHYPHGTDAGVLDVFRWSNGLIEVPTTVLRSPNPFSSRQKYVGFESHRFSSLDDYKRYLEHFERTLPQIQTIVLVLHSWSFLDQAGGKYMSFSEDKYNAFRGFLEWACGRYSFNIGARGRLPPSSAESGLVVPLQFAGVGGSLLARL